METDVTAEARLQALASAPNEAFSIAECALLIAATRLPALDVERYIARLDVLTDAVRAGLSPSSTLVEQVQAINRHLIGVEGFRGNTDDYSDVRNSFLNEVLERKLGIPITLSVLYIEIAERLGLDVKGVGFPGHFLVRFGTGQQVIVIDPFFGGISLSENDLVERMRRFIPDETQARLFLVQVLRGTSKVEILARMLRNLREIYAAEGDLSQALTAANQIVNLTPGDHSAVRDRGALYLRLEVPHAAIADYTAYLNAAPEAPDAAQIRERLVELQANASRLN